MRGDRAEAAAVVEELLQRQLLPSNDQDIVVEPSLVNGVPGGVVQRTEIDAGDLDADLRAHPAHLHHWRFLLGWKPSPRRRRCQTSSHSWRTCGLAARSAGVPSNTIWPWPMT